MLNPQIKFNYSYNADLGFTVLSENVAEYAALRVTKCSSTTLLREEISGVREGLHQALSQSPAFISPFHKTVL